MRLTLEPESIANPCCVSAIQNLFSSVSVALLQVVTITLMALKRKETDFAPKTLGEHIRKRRRELGITQKEVSNQLGVTQTTLIKWKACQKPAEWADVWPFELDRIVKRRSRQQMSAEPRTSAETGGLALSGGGDSQILAQRFI